jgi:FAD dependent oxidoreductase
VRHFGTCILQARFLLPILAALLSLAHPATAATKADVVVYGSTPGGFCAAIAAAREGASVVLLEPTDHVGAMSTGGLSHCDSNQMVRSTVMGLFHEWHTRVVKDYTDRGLKAPYDPTVKDQAVWVFEPHVAMRVTKKMLDEAGVKVLVNERIKSVKKDGRRITSIVTKNDTFTAKVFVDGTYEGDLMAAAGVDWTIGREGRAEYGEPLAGKKYTKPKMNINGFDDNGKLLPLLTTDDGGKDEAGDKNVMTYSFRLCLTADPKNRVAMPKPTQYDPARFEIVRRYLKAGGDVKKVGFDLYPLPGNKRDGNNSIGGQFSLGLVGGGNDWHTADEAGRKKIWEAHKQYTLEFYQFLTTDPAVPKNVQDTYARLGLCKDEFATYDHFSPALYVRESRRMKGLYVISQKDILDAPKKDDPIAISSFPIDSHDCQRIALKGGGVLNEGTIFPVRRQNPKQGYAYHVPYRSVLPKPEQCENLLVPVALSCTHVGISSLRIEGAWMVIGQGSGVAAALAAKDSVAVQDVPYEKLRKRLLAQGQVLDLPAPEKRDKK